MSNNNFSIFPFATAVKLPKQNIPQHYFTDLQFITSDSGLKSSNFE